MPTFNAPAANTLAKLSWTRRVAINAALVLAALSISGSADAAVGCAAKAAHHAAPAQCQAHHLHAGVQAASPMKASLKAASVARIDSGEVVLSGPTFPAVITPPAQACAQRAEAQQHGRPYPRLGYRGRQVRRRARGNDWGDGRRDDRSGFKGRERPGTRTAFAGAATGLAADYRAE